MRRLQVAPTVVAMGLWLTVPTATQDPAPELTRPARPGHRIVEPEVVCPNQLGVGLATGLLFCDVMTGTDPAAGVIITVPPHRGDAFLTFDLHNRHTYSEELVKTGRAFTRYTAVIGALTEDNTLLSRAAVRSEFRDAPDLVDRVGGGAGPTGAKAVAPTGRAQVTITVPASEQLVSLLGEHLTVERAEGTATYASPDRPIAVVSNVRIEYRPGPARRPGQ